PVGLCFVAIGTPKGVYVYKNVFSGDREQIRQQASNSALYFLWKALNTK
ncbi:MAG: CinA family protein, partial [Clostridia bacterium]|nr:CinA family protein [Clostridia bacterium]